MRTIIAGSRDCTDYDRLCRVMVSIPWEVTVVVSGAARGVDRMGERWAKEHGIPVERFPAQWNAHGIAAGFIRNKVMVSNANALVALWDGKSKGTAHVIGIAELAKLTIRVDEGD